MHRLTKIARAGSRRLGSIVLRILPLALLLCVQGAAADDMVRFSVDDSLDGLRGAGSLPVYHGWATPRSRFNFQTNTVFEDSDLPGKVIMIAKNGDNQIDPATDQDQENSDTHEVLVGISNDGGDTFAFHRVLKFFDGRRLVRVAMVPDPGRLSVWAGIAQLWTDEPDSVSENYVGTVRLEINWNNRVVRFRNANDNGWLNYPFGFEDPDIPTLIDMDSTVFFTHLAEVDVGGQTRYEAWATIPVAPDEDHIPEECGPNDPVFASNAWVDQDDKGPGSKGRRIVYYRFYIGSGIDKNSEKVITSDTRDLPTAWQRSDQQVTRGQIDDGGVLADYLLVGTQDQIACEETINQNSEGASVRFIKLRYDAATDNYAETELDYLIDIANPTSPGWTCSDSRVDCVGTAHRHYAFVNAVPFIDSARSRVQLYVGAWGTTAPTLPAIGEAGHVSVGETPAVVPLSGSYQDPVVFAQTMSWKDDQPALVRVSHVTPTSFRLQLVQDSQVPVTPAHARERVSYVVLEEGTYRLLDKRVLEVAKLPVSKVVPEAVTWTSTLDLVDSHDMSTGAIAFTQLQTANHVSYAKTRHLGAPTLATNIPFTDECNSGICVFPHLAKVSFGVELEEADLGPGVSLPGNETVGVLMIGESWIGRKSSVFGLGPWGARGFDIGRVGGVGGISNWSWSSIVFEPPRGTHGLNNPVLLAAVESRLGDDPTSVRYFDDGSVSSLTPSGVDLGLDEDTSADSERHHNRETIVYWVLGKGSGVIRAQPIDRPIDIFY
ncbi:MAG: hypothetical protein AAGC60_03485 [Acidobacteriota bacterium]